MNSPALRRPGAGVPSPVLRRGDAAALVVAALALAALSLLAPWSLAFDPWAWAVWGREVWHGTLDTAGGPSWKPLPVVTTTVLVLAGGAAPALWLVLARAGGLLALAGAHRLGSRLAGPVAAWTAVAAMAVSEWWMFNSALGNSEGLLAAAVLWAIAAHLAGRFRLALALAVAAALLRPEVWPFLAVYALWLLRRGTERAWVLVVALAPVPLLWLGPDVLGAGGALGASEAARGAASPGSAAHADIPGLQVLTDFVQLLTPPVALAALAGAVTGGAIARRLGVMAVAWVAIVATMAQAGYAGNPRYDVPAAAVCCVLAGVGAVWAARALAGAGAVSAARALAGAAVIVAAALAFTAPTLADQIAELGDRADRRTDLATLVADAGGAVAIRACAPARTAQAMKSMVAWRLDVPLAGLTAPPRSPAVVLRAPAGYAGEPPAPAPSRDARFVGTAGAWSLFAACASGHRLSAAAAPRGPA